MANEFVIKKGLIVQGGRSQNTGSLDVSGSITGSGLLIDGRISATSITSSLYGTASWATNVVNVVAAPTAFTATQSIWATQSLWATSSITSSYLTGSRAVVQQLTASNAYVSGSVGIGVTTPRALTHIASGGEGLRISTLNDDSFFAGFSFDNSTYSGTLNPNRHLAFGADVSSFNYYLQTKVSNPLGSASDRHLLLQPYSGNVGIGTAAPLTKLHVAGGIMVNENEKISSRYTAGDPGPYQWITIKNTPNHVMDFVNQTNQGTTKAFSFYGYESGVNVERVSILGGGNVGIGTTTPQAGLHIYNGGGNTAIIQTSRVSAGTTGLNFWNSVSGSRGIIGFDPTDNYFVINSNGGGMLINTAGGNVGIGISQPSASLHVLGVITASAVSASQFGGNLTGSVYGTASWATNVVNGVAAPTAFTATQSIWATQSLWSTNSLNAVSAAWASSSVITNQAVFSSQSLWATNSLNATSASWASSSLNSISASFSTQTITASYVSGARSEITRLSSSFISGFGTGALTLGSGSTATGVLVSLLGVTNNFYTSAGGGIKIMGGAAASAGGSQPGGSVTIDGGSTTDGVQGSVLIGSIHTGSNVGIGTTNPSQKLEVSGSIYASAGNFLAPAGNYFGYNSQAAFVAADSSLRTGILAPGSIHLQLDTNNDQTDRVFSVLTNGTTLDSGTELFRVQENGNVGVGTTAPNRKLSVSGSMNLTGSVDITGTLTAAIKSFLIDHPTKAGRMLQYGSIESPYHGIQLSGRNMIIGGIRRIDLPDYLHALVHEDGINIQLTNIKHSTVLFVDEINLKENFFTVSSAEITEMECGFFWMLTAVRKDVPDLKVEI